MRVSKTQKCSSALEVFVLDLGLANQGRFRSTLFWKLKVQNLDLFFLLLCERRPYLMFAAGLSLFSNHLTGWANSFIRVMMKYSLLVMKEEELS